MIQVPEVECLKCRKIGKCITEPSRIETIEGIIIRPLACQICGSKWKDFYGEKDENSVILSIQRNPNNDYNRPDSPKGNNKLPESEKVSQDNGHETSKASSADND
jgi:hypothetical protein